MIVWFVLILSIVWVSLATALYSNFLPYLSLLSDVKNYNMAYYGANTAIERSLLVLRYQEAWFEWTGWWNKNLWSIVTSPVSDQWWLWYFDQNTTTLQRTIVSRPNSQSIPGTWQGDTDFYLLSGSSNDWNKLDYRRPQQIPLWVDSTSSDQAYVVSTGRTFFTGSNIVLNLQLIPSVKEKFSNWVSDWELNNDNDWDWDGINDDVIVNRWRKWLYDTSSEFSILPRSLVSALNDTADIESSSSDESIRENIINTVSSPFNSYDIVFWDFINPLYNDDGSPLKSNTQNNHLMISDDNATTSGISTSSFNDLLWDSDLSSQELNFFLTNALISKGDWIYPFLQYNIGFEWNPATISQPYFTINGKSQVWDYTVQMNLRKSINKNDALWSFTVVF
jgi:hypothetical protein